MRVTAFAAAVAAAVAVAFAGDAASSDVATLTSKTFDGTISKEELVLVKFFAPWCGHCKSMAEDFSKAATTLKGKAVLADVDATVEESLAQKYNVEGFPTLKLFMNGKELTDYKGGRDYDSMVKFVESAKKPAYDTVDTQAQHDDFMKQNKGSNVLVGVSLSQAKKDELTKASFALRDLFPDTLAFSAVKDASVSTHLAGAVADSFVFLRIEGDEVTPSTYDSKKHNSIEAFVKAVALPTFTEFTQDNADLYTELSTPIIVGFFEADKIASDPNYAVLKSVAQKMKGNGKVNFVWVDNKTLASFKEYVGLKDTAIPVCSYTFEKDEKLMLPSDMKTLTDANLQAWVEDVIDGKIAPIVKSEPIPEKQPETGPKVVVGDSWKTIVEDPTKDVLVAQVAPWCGHCKSLKPALIRVTEELKKAGVENVVIATMDATENDAPAEYKAKGFPTMHFFKAANEPGEEYDGGRSTQELINFLSKNAVNKFTFDTSKLAADPEETEDEAEADKDLGDEGDAVEDDFDDGLGDGMDEPNDDALDEMHGTDDVGDFKDDLGPYDEEEVGDMPPDDGSEDPFPVDDMGAEDEVSNKDSAVPADEGADPKEEL